MSQIENFTSKQPVMERLEEELRDHLNLLDQKTKEARRSLYSNTASQNSQEIKRLKSKIKVLSGQISTLRETEKIAAKMAEFIS